MNLKYITIIFVAMLPLSVFAQNRITGPADPAKRCTTAISGEKCEKLRQKAKNNGCITNEEYQTLKNFGSYPTCEDVEDDGKMALTGWCPCGCFHPETLISVFNRGSQSHEEVPAEKVTQNHSQFELVHLDESSTLKNFSFGKTGIRIPTIGPETHPLIVVEGKNGSILKVTDKHPILTSRGEMVQAAELKPEDGLIDQDGNPVEISSIKKETFDGNVVNFMVDSGIDRKLEHVIFAEKVAVGDLAWQSSLEDEHQQIILRQ